MGGHGILTFYVWYQTESVKLGIDIGRSEQRIRDLEKAIDTLELRKAALLDPGRLRGSPANPWGWSTPSTTRSST